VGVLVQLRIAFDAALQLQNQTSPKDLQQHFKATSKFCDESCQVGSSGTFLSTARRSLLSSWRAASAVPLLTGDPQ